MSQEIAGMNTDFDKYEYYLQSVQSPSNDAEFLYQTFLKTRERAPRKLREDFCGTFALCCEWVKLHPENTAVGVDLDQEPLDYGKQRFFDKLDESQKSRLQTVKENVLAFNEGDFDVINALNFSYFIFKRREELRNYFSKVYESLGKDGIFFLDVFGGSEVSDIHEEETEFEDDDFSYYWDQDSYNPINNHAQFYIHFKRKGEKKREKVFSYDWRVWSIPELRDLLTEVGFSQTKVYWEGTDDDGEGNGEFLPSEEGEPNCESWVAYIAAEK